MPRTPRRPCQPWLRCPILPATCRRRRRRRCRLLLRINPAVVFLPCACRLAPARATVSDSGGSRRAMGDHALYLLPKRLHLTRDLGLVPPNGSSGSSLCGFRLSLISSDSTLGAALAGVVMHTKRERRGWRVTAGCSACGSGRGPSRLRPLADPCRRCRPLGAAHVPHTRSQSARRSRLQWSPARSRTTEPGPSATVGHGGSAEAQGPAPAAAR